MTDATNNRDPLPRRKRLPHAVPSWVPEGSRHFITINCAERERNSLCIPHVGEALMESAQVYDRLGRWGMLLFLVMPDHLHMVAVFDRQRGVKPVVSAWKSYQAKKLRIEWQAGFFEHRLRDDAEVVEKCHYVRMNPVRKKLVALAEEWPFVWQRA
jgi:putative transposase